MPSSPKTVDLTKTLARTLNTTYPNPQQTIFPQLLAPKSILNSNHTPSLNPNPNPNFNASSSSQTFNKNGNKFTHLQYMTYQPIINSHSNNKNVDD